MINCVGGEKAGMSRLKIELEPGLRFEREKIFNWGLWFPVSFYRQ